MLKWVGIFLIYFCLWGCSPSSLEEYHYEGQTLSKKLLNELKSIESREDLERAVPYLKKQFESLVDLMIEARNFQEKYPEEYFDEPEYAVSLDDELLEEIKRIYQLEKGRVLIEKAQRESLLRLDAFKRSLIKQRSGFK